MVAIGLAAVIFGTVPAIAEAYDARLTEVSLVMAILFAVEYGIRLLQATRRQLAMTGAGDSKSGGHHRRAVGACIAWAKSPLAIVDLLAALPVPLALVLAAPSSTVRLFGIFWALKLVRYTSAFALLARVVRNEAHALVGVMVGFMIVWLIAATSVHIFERGAQPTVFDSIPHALWWSIVTLTTTGYGDVTPTTVFGRVLAGVTMICGIAIFALWAGILASGFSQEVRRRDFLQTWALVANLPLFRSLGAATIAEVAKLLRPQEVGEGRTIMRRGEPGDCVYFVATGEVEILLRPAPVRLGPGGFFGEMALITGEPRSATVVATRPTTLLMLDVAEFRGLAASQPDLLQAIEAEAAQRREVRA